MALGLARRQKTPSGVTVRPSCVRDSLSRFGLDGDRATDESGSRPSSLGPRCRAEMRTHGSERYVRITRHETGCCARDHRWLAGMRCGVPAVRRVARTRHRLLLDLSFSGGQTASSLPYGVDEHRLYSGSGYLGFTTALPSASPDPAGASAWRGRHGTQWRQTACKLQDTLGHSRACGHRYRLGHLRRASCEFWPPPSASIVA